MLVVADTSVLLNLCYLNVETLLPRLFGAIWTTDAVRDEFNRLAETTKRFRGLTFPSFLNVRNPLFLHSDYGLGVELDAGESSALALARELHADLVLIDEQAGRTVAGALGFRVSGVKGVLLKARKAGAIPAVAPLLDRLQYGARFWIAPSLRQSVLREVGE